MIMEKAMKIETPKHQEPYWWAKQGCYLVLCRGNHKSIDTIPQDGGQENKQGGVLDPSILFLSHFWVQCSVQLHRDKEIIVEDY